MLSVGLLNPKLCILVHLSSETPLKICDSPYKISIPMLVKNESFGEILCVMRLSIVR